MVKGKINEGVGKVTNALMIIRIINKATLSKLPARPRSSID